MVFLCLKPEFESVTLQQVSAPWTALNSTYISEYCWLQDESLENPKYFTKNIFNVT